MSWRSKQAEFDQFNLLIGRILGLALGSALGAIIGLLIDWRVNTVVLFHYDIVIACAVVFGLLGYIFEERFVRFIGELLEHPQAPSPGDWNDFS